MKVKFLGTNNWYDTDTGNTPCVFIDYPECYIAFDAGFGFYKLENQIKDERPIYVFLSHFHLDHIIGLFTMDEFKLKQAINIFGPPKTKEILNNFMRPPIAFHLDKLSYKVNINELSEGAHSTPIPITCKYLLHNIPIFGYCIERGKKSIAYCTDTGLCDNLLELANDVDLLILECAFKSGETNPKWPHINPEVAGEIGKRCKPKKLVITNFDAKRYTNIKDRENAEKIVKSIYKNVVAAKDGMALKI